MDSSKQIKLGAILSYVMIVFNVICGLIYTPWMIGKIGKADYGIYVLVTTFIAYFVVDFGIWQAITKIVSEKRANKDIEGERNVIGIATRIYLYLDIIVCIALCIAYFFIDTIFSNLEVEQLNTFKRVYFIACAFSVLSFPFGHIKAIFVSYELYVQTKIFDFIVKIGIILLTVVCLSLGGAVYSLVFVYGCVPFIVNICRCFVLRQKNIKMNIFAVDRLVVKEIFSTSGLMFITVLAELFINNISPTIIAARSNVEEVALWGIGITIYGYVYSFAMSLNGLFLPKVSQLYANGDINAINELTNKVGRIQAFFLGMLVFGFISVGKYFIELWVGPDFEKAYYISVLLIFPQLFQSMLHIQIVHLLASGKIKYQSIGMSLTAITSVVISIVLVPYYGAIGAAFGVAIANTLFMVLFMLRIYNKHANFNVLDFSKRTIPIILVLVVSMIMTIGLSHCIATCMLLRDFAVLVVVFLMCYTSMSWFVMNSFEKGIIRNILSKLFNNENSTN